MLVAAMLIVVGVGTFILNQGTSPDFVGEEHPWGTFIGIPQSRDGYQLTFGVIAPPIKFDDCNIALSINGIHQAAQHINVIFGNEFTANKIIWTDLANDGVISYGDNLVISNPVSTFAYKVEISMASNGDLICFQSWTIP